MMTTLEQFSKRKKGEWIGLMVRPVKAFSMDVLLIPGYPTDRRDYGPDDTFVVEHDFRYAGDTIHIGCPNGDWAEFAPERFADVFGDHAMQVLDLIAEMMGGES